MARGGHRRQGPGRLPGPAPGCPPGNDPGLPAKPVGRESAAHPAFSSRSETPAWQCLTSPAYYILPEFSESR
jgi:hypothetical protein